MVGGGELQERKLAGSPAVMCRQFYMVFRHVNTYMLGKVAEDEILIFFFFFFCIFTRK